jgi:hypothetical protein
MIEKLRAAQGRAPPHARRLVTITVLAAAIWALAVPQAGAYSIGGQPWPADSVTYYSPGGPRARALVDRAARMWNRAHVGFEFKRGAPADAQVLVSGDRTKCAGSATVGYPGAQPSWLYVGRCQSGLVVLTIAHEFGHVLGLGHERRRCALMNPRVDRFTGTRSGCRPNSLAHWLKHPLQRDDIRGARVLAAPRGVGGFAARWSRPAGLERYFCVLR